MTVAVSAPGKVLLAGGFLVLDRKHRGLVFGLDARIHVCIDAELTENGIPQGHQKVVVRSPQFERAEWVYDIGKREGGRSVEVVQVKK